MDDKPLPFTIIIDTREQLPWVFDGIETIREPLGAGDYSIVGLTALVAIERKSLHDFVNTIIHNRERFRKECQKLAGMMHSCIIVEAGIDDVKYHRYKSRAKPGSVLAIADAIEKQFNIPIVWAGNRFGAICRAREFLVEGWLKFGA